LFLLYTLAFISCNTTEPIVEDNVVPGSRDYEWTVDTLNIPFNILTRIWGLSPTNVWATGGGGGMDKTIWHFDGTKWSTDNISRPVVPASIFGFTKNDVWIGGNQGLIWHYNGSTWGSYTKYEIQDYPYTALEDLWGDEWNNVYAVGYAADGTTYKGIILHYDGKKWEEVKIPSINISFIKIRRARNESPNYYLRGVKFGGSIDSAKIYEFNGKNIKEIYAGTANSGERCNLEQINDGMFFQKGYGLSRYRGGYFHPFYTIQESKYGGAFGGRSSKDIFLRMEDGIAHYNGSDVQYIFKTNDINMSLQGTFVIFEKEVFVMADNVGNGSTYIIRGKLKED